MATRKKKTTKVNTEQPTTMSVAPVSEATAYVAPMSAIQDRTSSGLEINDRSFWVKTEPGKPYVLSVNSASGQGEIEVLSADYDTQPESEMFSIVYSKVEHGIQISFVALSRYVYINTGGSDVDYRIIQSNVNISTTRFYKAGGGETPTIEETMYIKTIPLVAESAYATNDAVLPAEAPSGFYEVLIPSIYNESTYTVVAYNQGSGGTRSDVIMALEASNPPLMFNMDYLIDDSLWLYEQETGGSTFAVPGGSLVKRLSCYFQHVKGEATSLIKLSGNNVFTQGDTVGTIIVRRLA